jgi:hypothetical protein
MFEIALATDPEGCPTGIGNPAVLFGEIALKEKVTNRARKWNVDVSPEVDLTDFGLAEAVFQRREPVRVYGNPRPR